VFEPISLHVFSFRFKYRVWKVDWQVEQKGEKE